VMHLTDWYATLLGLAGASWENDALERDLGPVDGKDFWQNIVQESTQEVHEELHLSPWTFLTLQDGSWFKLTTQVQTFDMWMGPDYPNNTDQSVRPPNSSPLNVNSPHDCFPLGCLFNLDDDPSEYNNLNTSIQHEPLLNAMVDRLQELNVEGYVEPFRGCLETEYSCPTFRGLYDNHYGSWVNVDCATCIGDAYWEGCRDRGTCVKRTTNECQCHRTRMACSGHRECAWDGDSLFWFFNPWGGTCDRKEEFKGMSRAQLILLHRRSAERKNGLMPFDIPDWVYQTLAIIVFSVCCACTWCCVCCFAWRCGWVCCRSPKTADVRAVELLPDDCTATVS